MGDQKGASEQIPSAAKAAQKGDDDGGTEVSPLQDKSSRAGPPSFQSKSLTEFGTAPSQSLARVRGTQSFVHTLSECWRRPSLTALEVLWRWAYGVPALLVLRY